MQFENYSLEHVIQLYLTRCDLEGKSAKTVSAYSETLGQFLRIAKDVRQITTEHILKFLAWVKSRGVSEFTQHRRHRETRFLFIWLERLGIVEQNPFRYLKNLRLPQKIIQPIKPEEIHRLLEARFPNDFLATRNKTIVVLMLDTGIRLGELISLKLDYLDIENQRLRILHAKGKKERIVRVGTTELNSLKEYLAIRGDQPGQVFLSTRGQAIRPNSIRVMLRRLAQRAGVRHVHPHQFRHTFATWAIEAEAREIDVQCLLGHSTPVMVRRYWATYSAEKAARAHARWSPADPPGPDGRMRLESRGDNFLLLQEDGSRPMAPGRKQRSLQPGHT